MANGRRWKRSVSRRAASVGLAAAAAVAPMTGYRATPAGAAVLTFGPPAAWPTAFTSYTTGGESVRDGLNAGRCVDPSTGGSAPTGANDIFSGTPTDCTVSSLGSLGSAYYHYDATADVYFFRLRVAGNPLGPNASSGRTLNNQDPLGPVTYNLLIDTDGDGYKEFTAVLNGDYGSNGTPYDRVEIYYADTATQTVTASDLVASGPAATVTTAYKNGSVWDFGATRVTDETAIGGGHLIDFQVPGNAFVNGAGDDLVSAATPMSFFFTTATSNNDPLQKDAAYAGLFNARGAVPGGDTVVGNTIVQAPITSSIGLSGACPGPISLAVRLQDGFSVTDGTTITSSVQSVVFEYTLDADGNSVPDTTNAWDQLASASQSALVSDPALWTATFDATSLRAGIPVLIRAKATDLDGNIGYSAFDPPAPGIPNRFATFTATAGCFPSPPPGAPTAIPDVITTPEGTPLTTNVLANDVGTGLVAISATAPANGTLECDSTGTCTYTPNANFSGTDSFTYLVRDSNGLEATGNVTITVTPVNDAPVGADDAYSTVEDTTLLVAAPGVLANDTDVERDSLTAVVVDSPTNGTVTLNPDGSFSYIPFADYHGTDTFTYTPRDAAGAVGAVTTVTIRVNPANDGPGAVADSYTTDEDTWLNVTSLFGVLANDTDIDGGALTAAVADGPAHGELTLRPDGSFTYVPDADYNGGDSFTYTVSDGAGGEATGTVTIDVVAVNDAPVALDDSYATNEDTPLVVPVAGVVANDSDVDGNPLTAAVADGPAHGTLTLNANGSFTYTPARDFVGTDSFTYTVSDAAGGTDTATVTINVVAVNDAPIGVDDAYAVDEDSILTVAAPGVLGNDDDIDGDVISVELVSSPKNGTVVLDAVGSFVYSPFANYAGTDSFTYRVVDAKGLVGNVVTVTITIRPAEVPLVIAPAVAPPKPGGIIPEVFSGALETAAPVAPRFGELPRSDTETVEVPARAGELPRTGADPRQLSQFGALLVLLGSAVRRAARPRRRK